jgi:hypothetical protein
MDYKDWKYELEKKDSKFLSFTLLFLAITIAIFLVGFMSFPNHSKSMSNEEGMFFFFYGIIGGIGILQMFHYENSKIILKNKYPKFRIQRFLERRKERMYR